MSTFLSKLFKPKWQSKNKATRLEAIKELSDSRDEDKQALVSIIETDSDTDVVEAAITKISDSQTLANLHQGADTDIRKLIEEQLQTLANSQSLSIFDLVLDPKLLTEMITSASNPDPFINGLARIEDSSTLLSIAIKGKTSKIRQAAAELVSSESDLKALIQEVKSKDKRVYQIAKVQLDKLRKEAKAIEDAQAQILSVVNSIEEQAKTDNTNQYESRLESLNKRWLTISSQASPEIQERYQKAYSQCETRIKETKAEEEARLHEELMEKAGGDEQQATLLTLEQTLQQFHQQAAAPSELPALDALIKTQETRWLEATKQSSVEKAQAKHYQVLMSSLRAYLKALQTLKEHENELQAVMAELSDNTQSKASNKSSEQANQSNKALTRLLNQIDWPSDLPAPALLDEAKSALGIVKGLKEKFAQNAEQALSEIELKIEQLDSALEERQVKQSSKLLKQIQSLISRLNSKQGEKVHNQLNLRIKQLNELRDWQGYASSPRQQELCEQMERLIDQTLPPQDKADKIKAMQNEWKSLGGARDEALWNRFKEASDKAYEPCKAYFSEQGALKENNAAKRKTLIEQLSTFVNDNDWSSPDWKAVDKINKKARQEWRDAYPIDHKTNRPLQKQFNELLDQLDNYLSTERKQNIELKTQVVERAEMLKDETDLNTAMNAAKQLQKEWQAIGITEHKQDRALWKRFRSACDSVFERRDQQREASQAEKAAALNAAQSMIQAYQEKLTSIGSLDIDQTKLMLDQLRQDNKNLAPLSGKALDKHHEQFEAIVKTAKQHIKALKNIGLKQGWEEAARQASIIRTAYLSENIEIEQLEAELNSADAELPKEIKTPIKELWISVKAKAVKSTLIINHDLARENCIRCEISAGLDSPEQDKELRMQLQVTRLSEGLSAAENLSREEQLINALKAWYTSVGLSNEDCSVYEARIRNCMDTLFA